MLRHVYSRFYLAGGRCGCSAVLSSIAAPKVPSYFSKVGDDDDDVSPSPVKIYQGSSNTFNSFHGHGHSGGTVRFFSGIRNFPRDEALKYMSRLKKASSTEAIDILEDIEREGFIPDVSHFNKAISICAKDGKLDEAKKIFRRMKQNRVVPDEITFNSLIDACALVGNDKDAIRHLREMEEKYDLWPNVLSYSSAISACEKAGNWEVAIDLLREMQSRGVELNVISFNSTISACEKGGQTEMALDLLIEMENRGIDADQVTFSAAISACEKGGAEHTDTALSLFREMCNRNVWPTVVTYSATISACEKGGAEYTDTALALFDEMKAHGIMPDVVVFNAVISACGKGGGKYVEVAMRHFNEINTLGMEPSDITYTAITKTCYDNQRYPEALKKVKEAVSTGFLSPLEAESKEWDLHGMSEAEACILLASALLSSVDTKSFRGILVITGKDKKSLELRGEGPVLQLKVPAFLRDAAGLELSEHVKRGEVNEGAFVITKKALKKWAKSDDYIRFRALMTGEEN